MTLAYTLILGSVSFHSRSSIASSSSPVTAISPCLKKPSSEAMATAVSLWSPVIIRGVMPAFFAFATAAKTSSRGGSIMPASPTNVSPLSRAWALWVSRGPEDSRYASARTLSASFDRSSVALSIAALSASVMGRALPPS